MMIVGEHTVARRSRQSELSPLYLKPVNFVDVIGYFLVDLKVPELEVFMIAGHLPTAIVWYIQGTCNTT
jgi:hypothetical protein